MNCKNCNIELNSKFCPDCGQPAKVERIDGHYIIHEIEHVLHFDRGILHTVRELISRPGPSIRNYLSENRSLLVKPIIFIILTSLIYTVISRIFHLEEEVVHFEVLGKSIETIFKWIQGNYGYANILIGVFIAIWLKIFFRKHNYNFFELLIMLCFVQGVSMLIFVVFALAENLLHFELFDIAEIICALYIIYGIGNFFETKKIGNYLKALISYILGLITFSICILAVATIIEVLTKH